MDKIYIGLGGNFGDRVLHLSHGINELNGVPGLNVLRVAPFFETPPKVPSHVPSAWSKKFYLNTVVEAETSMNPWETLKILQRIEIKLGRPPEHKAWEPRPLDLDILIFGNQIIQSDVLCIPHIKMKQRSFVLDPLSHLVPSFKLPQCDASITDLANSISPKQPLLMGIVNMTPDSFYDGGKYFNKLDKLMETLIQWRNEGIMCFDFGAESTRPGATFISPAEEKDRLLVLEDIFSEIRLWETKILISLDTRRAKIAEHFLKKDQVDIVNDVSGLGSEEMLDLVKNTNVDFVVMHNMGIPADPANTMDSDCDCIREVRTFFDGIVSFWRRESLNPDRLILDPGIGFGKNDLQSLALIRGIRELRISGVRMLLGYSNKSFMKDVHVDRSLATLGISASLLSGGADFLRVHNPLEHKRLFMAYLSAYPGVGEE